MSHSFIELPSFKDVKDLSRSVKKEVDKTRPLVGAPASVIFAAQSINSFFSYGLGTLILLCGLFSVPTFKLDWLLSAGSTFWMGAGLLIWLFYFMTRTVCWVYLGKSLGEYCMGIEGGAQDKFPLNATLWESLHFICPALWLFETCGRLMSMRMGVPYSFSYVAPK